ncbi:GATA zinc finger domain-containing protein 14 [Folsomia candida]|uniref:GATA zinc finger domain-containing protein 14 n=1 Tax=Folsomia candida TaxID=158441 RepID=UPI000B900D9A|nr:GATA zinc finger domain-containing protein 14 [Folsomia candida]
MKVFILLLSLVGVVLGGAADSRGLFDNQGVFGAIKSFFTTPQVSKDNGGTTGGLPPKYLNLNRVPKPPKYPLYDLDTISLATPPPAPVMHPMSSLPSDQFNDNSARSEIVTTNNRFHDNNRPNRRRGQETAHPPPPRNIQRRKQYRRPMKNQKNNHGNHGNNHNHQKPPTKQTPPKKDEYFSHPMATNLEPVKTSPALGRPLGFDEYMQRPSNSFVNDPWNFDPFANQMNAGLHTSGLKYNYDPLGTNNDNNIDMSHLNPEKLSFLGDSFIKDGNLNKNYVNVYDGNNFNNNQNSNHGNNFNNNNHGNNYNTHGNGQQQNFHDSSPSQSIQYPQKLLPNQKIEFTIETSPDGINIESVQPMSTPHLTDQYSPHSAPLGPSGYTPQQQNYQHDSNTPIDILPPINSPSSSFY